MATTWDVNKGILPVCFGFQDNLERAENFKLIKEFPDAKGNSSALAYGRKGLHFMSERNMHLTWWKEHQFS